ncbi:MAG: ComEC family competence protein [Mediterranea massiliensis]|nr:ComEC family competence protein [Mediterranea massiliensis]
MNVKWQQHPFLHVLLPLLCGIVFGEYVNPTFSSLSYLYSLLFVFLCLLVAYKYFSRLFTSIAYVFFFILGIHLMNRYHDSYSFPYIGQEDFYQAIVSEHPEEKERSLLCKSVISDKDFLLYFPKDSLSYTIKRGDKLIVYTQLTSPQNNGNPYEFDYARYLYRKGIVGSAYVPTGCWVKIGNCNTQSWRQKADDCRQKIIDLYTQIGLKDDALAVLVALTLGDKTLIDEELRETYSVAGVSHVLALSGLHIGLLTWLLLLFWKPIVYRLPVLRPFSLLLTIFLLSIYAFFTGLSPSVVRSVLMFSLLALAGIYSPQKLSLNLLAATAFLMLIIHPVWLFDVGFQLSFMAVVGIIFFYARFSSFWKPTSVFLQYLWSGICVTLSAQIMTAPLVVYYFSSFPVYFLLANIWILAWIAILLSLTLFMLLLTPVPCLQTFLAQTVDGMLTYQHAMLRWIEQLPGSSLSHLWMDKVDVLFCYLLLWLLFYCWHRPLLRSFYILLITALLALGYHFVAIQIHAPHTSIVFYNHYATPSLHLLTDNAESWLLLPSVETENNPISRSLKRYWNSMQLDEPHYISFKADTILPDFSIYDDIVTYHGHRIALLADDSWWGKYADEKLTIDFLYVSKGYYGTLKEATSLFTIRKVVLDSSLPQYLSRQWVDECNILSVPCVLLSETGCFSAEIMH